VALFVIPLCEGLGVVLRQLRCPQEPDRPVQGGRSGGDLVVAGIVVEEGDVFVGKADANFHTGNTTRVGLNGHSPV